MELNAVNGDFASLRAELAKMLTDISETLNVELSQFEPGHIRLLNVIGDISKKFSAMESLTSTYYLEGLLSEHTASNKEISRAVHRLSTKGHAALIVIEKNDSVLPYLSGGTPIQARISSQLLETLFHPASEFHEGAVLIQGETIVSAGHALPLTEEIFWDRMYDVRELSAVGLSERCDALVLLVSDSGATSVGSDGKLIPVSISS
ncbi:diadenylate cyclase [Cohnella thailandensis]|uniref:DNA integrity scanning protein DisA nucleotide-binding domain protein n=1 Tax=Cohnella thailandensis TaxID=557557 RepID=A0A841STZ6_9BACL|nr:diadenylate cyclase [Cohnella thailandensis]MBB6633370.1 DNA integrity scanning protein DisA nucleotide-binding domain protein [Cohnella thailandensis]MBP1977287.1 DNA integrity scanning protein DisA with diadenylate cyclase activity [Cohnella thailandensis]